MNITILSPNKGNIKGKGSSVKVPGASGYFEVLENHAPIVSALKEGEVRIIKESNDTLKINIEDGFIEVLRNEVAILVKELEE